MELTALTAFFLFLTGLLAGVVESTAGGSGLVVLPVLLFAGLSPTQALGTSKLQYAFGALVAIGRFSQAKMIRLPALKLYLAISLLMGVMGALILVHTEAPVLGRVMPFLLMASAIYFALSPRIKDAPSAPRIKPILFGLGPVALIAFYDGFFGVGSASFYVLAMVWGLGLSATQATACTKLVDFFSGVAALTVMVWHGQVIWKLGIILGAGQMLGAWIGAGLVIRKGTRVLRPLLVTVSLLLSLKLLWDSWG